MKHILALIYGVFILFSCGDAPEKTYEKPTVNTQQKYSKDDYLRMGDSISLRAQSKLVTHLMSAINSGGYASAVKYCSLEAGNIMDTVSTEFFTVSRISDRNRNPNNAASASEKELFKSFERGTLDTLIVANDETIYYKSIRIGMDVCLKCHGTAEEIDKYALERINKTYPNDKAIGYSNAELRGVWKVVFNK
jgi:hypothetical protein